MKSLITAIFLAVSLLPIAQIAPGGMQFEHNSTWKDVLAKAKKENKYIFVDAYTTWCGPCKMMAKNIFPLKEVGDFYNANYINLKVQLDTTANDDDEVKHWYQDAHDIMVNYHVKVFPTYLFLSPNGELVHRAVGASDATTFILKGKNALDSNSQYYPLAARYQQGERDPQFLRRLALACQEAYDEEMLPVYANAYLATQSNLLTEENIRFISKFTTSSKDKGFELMMKHPARFDAVLGPGMAKGTIRMIIMQEDIFPVIWGRNSRGANWTDLEKSLATKYPSVGKEVVQYAQVFYYQQTGEWEKFAPAVVKFMDQYGMDSPPAELNNLAWAIFENCDDMACIEKAIVWAKRAKAANDPNFYDTYANLLYKSGKKEQAIKAQEETVALAKSTRSSNLKEFEETLAKMRKGDKTW